MANFEEETARRIKQQLESGELDIEENSVDVSETKVEEPVETTETSVETTNETNLQEEKVINNSIDGKDIISKALGIKNSKTNHFERKEKTRPLAIVAGVLSFIICLGIIAVGVFAVIKLAIPLWGIIEGLFYTFFNEKVLAFTLGIGCIFGAAVILMVFVFFFGILLFLASLTFTTIGIPIVAFKTSKLPKQVFAYEADSFGNMIFSYIVGLLVMFIGFAMYMDGSFKYAPFIVFGVGVVFLLIAILITIDIVQCKKAFKNLQDEQEKQEIKQEAQDIKEAKKTRQRNRKLVGKVLGKLFRKK